VPFGFVVSPKHPGYGNRRYRRRWRASAVAPAGIFVRGGFMFSGQGDTAPLRNHRCFNQIIGGEPISTRLSRQGFFSVAICRARRLAFGYNSQAGRPRQTFLSVAGLRFAVYVALGLGRGFTTVPVSSLTLHSRGTGR
jgi:hypothetical protein